MNQDTNTNRARRQLSNFITLAFIAMLQGCIVGGRLDYSRPTDQEPSASTGIYESYHYPEVTTLRLHRADLQLAVAARADAKAFVFSPFPIPLPLIPWPPGIINSLFDPPEYEVAEMSLEFWIIPITGQVSFDPRRTIIHTVDGRDLLPATQQGPGILMVGDHNSCSLSTDANSNRIHGKVAERELIITKPVCIRLGFHITATPKSQFVVIVEGISKDGDQIVIHPIEFQKARRHSIWRVL